MRVSKNVWAADWAYLRAMILALIVMSVSGLTIVTSTSNDGDRVKVLVIGGPDQGLIMREPFFDVTPVVALRLWYPEDVIQRSMRLYMPRTYRQLVEGYDLVDLVYSEPRFFSHRVVKWLSDAVLENGSGFVLYGNTRYLFPWLETSIGEVSPVEELECFDGGDRVVWIRVLEPDNPLMASLPWSKAGEHGCFVGAQGIQARTGAQVLADKAPTGYGTVTPFLTWWEVGAGQCLCITPFYAVDNRQGNPFTSWEFYPDFVRNYNLFAASREIPSDPFLLHRISLILEQCDQARGMLISMTEFISEFGANTKSQEKELDNADRRLREINQAYLDYEFQISLSMAVELLTDLEDAFDSALRLKDHTLGWIYVIEWTVLAATGVLTGSMIWVLMISRRLYKESRITRLPRTPD